MGSFSPASDKHRCVNLMILPWRFPAAPNIILLVFAHGFPDQAYLGPKRNLSSGLSVQENLEDIPQAIRHGILIEISNLYENREDVIVGQAVNMVPLSERLLWPYRALTAD